MEDRTDRKLPVGIQSFSEIRKGGYIYIDKTDSIWKLANKSKKYIYLSRPRRFGKSLLVDTLQAYFEGKKELFEGLKIMSLENDWKQHSVIRLDMSRGGSTADALTSYLNIRFGEYEQLYDIQVTPGSKLADRFNAIIQTAFQRSGQQVVVLIDEYDSPLQHSWKTPEHDGCTDIYRDVFAILKADDEYERFVFITGITKFTQISLFSVLNNLTNISFDGPFANLCGISKEEATENLMPELERMADKNGWTLEETLNQLKNRYDGYHFSADNMVDVFNPFSLINALSDAKLKNYWAASGATSMLPKFVDNLEIRLKDFDGCPVDGDLLETSDVTDGGAELFLYQSGYLTIKNYLDGIYILGIPNGEVRKALYNIVVPTLTMRTSEQQVISTQNMLLLTFQNGDLEGAKKALKALIADVPYSNKKLASMDMEERYRLILSTLFNAIGFRVVVEKMIATGRIDMVVETKNIIYVMELKLTKNGGLSAAENQIINKQYLEPFKADKRKVIGLAVELDDLGKGLIDWKEI